MATTKEFLEQTLCRYFAEVGQDLTFKRAFGEYVLYYKGRVCGYLCDNQMIIKRISISEQMLGRVGFEPSEIYPGSKLHLKIDDKTDIPASFFVQLFEAMYPYLEDVKPKKKKSKATSSQASQASQSETADSATDASTDAPVPVKPRKPRRASKSQQLVEPSDDVYKDEPVFKEEL